MIMAGIIVGLRMSISLLLTLGPRLWGFLWIYFKNKILLLYFSNHVFFVLFFLQALYQQTAPPHDRYWISVQFWSHTWIRYWWEWIWSIRPFCSSDLNMDIVSTSLWRDFNSSQNVIKCKNYLFEFCCLYACYRCTIIDHLENKQQF